MDARDADKITNNRMGEFTYEFLICNYGRGEYCREILRCSESCGGL